MKTIRQIADEIGVSKTAVNKQIANLGLRSGLRKNGNQFAIDEHQEALIKQAFSEKSQTEIENQSQTKTQTENHEVGDLVCVLQATIDTLQGQLEVKDRQIAKLTEALVAAQQTAAAQSAGRIPGKRFELGAWDFGAAPGRDRGGAGLSGSALAGAVPAPGRKGAGAATCARGAAAGKRAGTGPHLGRYGVVKEACPGALQEPPGQAIITVKIGNKMY